jgi:isopentenyl-diphosphate delta-isomerase
MDTPPQSDRPLNPPLDRSLDRPLDRKDSHLSICLEEDISFHANGFSDFRFEHDALPELDYSRIDLSITLLGKRLAAPLIIGAMTGGTERTGEINRRLALAAEHCQVGFALGSQRKMLEDPSAVKSYRVRDFAPKLPLLFGNLGAVQLNYGVTLSQVRELIEQVGCDAFNFHLNPLQEAIQPEGNRNFAGLISKLKETIPELQVPVFLKEVGAGISLHTARKIKSIPFKGIETAGAGGTSWSKIEAFRSKSPVAAQTGLLFSEWGTPTAESVIHCRTEFPERIVIASGGIRNGIEIAKAIALGADAAATALPILKAAERSVEDAVQAIDALTTELKTAMFVTGMGSIEELRKQGKTLLHPFTQFPQRGLIK